MNVKIILILVLICLSCNRKSETTVKLEKPDTYSVKAEIVDNDFILAYIINPVEHDLSMVWQDADTVIYGNFENINRSLSAKNKKLIFAMNGGMYMENHFPQGLYIENGKTLFPVNKKKHRYGNFYMQPNGIFYLTGDMKGVVCRTDDFGHNKDIKYATQSGPMLVFDGTINPKFTIGSDNKHYRNGVGVMPNGNLVFAISKIPVNFYDFANYFLKQECINALYLDGAVSRMYLYSKNGIPNPDGNVGVIIIETE